MNNINLGKYKVMYPDREEYNIIKFEIFSSEIYRFKSDNPNPFVIDVGAHIGLSVLYFKLLYPNSRIIAFEPNIEIFNVLESNIRDNDILNVELINKAVFNRNGEIDFYVPYSNEAWGSNSSLYEGSWTGIEKLKKINVECVSLRKYLDKEIDLLKIDAESAELKILEDISGFLHNVKNLIVEYHPQGKSKFKKILSVLTKSGFKIEYIQNGRFVTNINIKELAILRATRQ